MNSESNSRLDWLAFCYAAGELDDAKSNQFEARLADDQEAREALARAVELTQTVAAAEGEPHIVTPATTTRAHWQSRASWMAIGGVAALLLAMLWSGVVGPTWKNARHSAAVQKHQQLANAWTQTRQEVSATSEPETWYDDEAAQPWDADSTEAFAAEETALEEAPSWMMAAVYARSASTTSSDPESNQRLEN